MEKTSLTAIMQGLVALIDYRYDSLLTQKSKDGLGRGCYANYKEYNEEREPKNQMTPVTIIFNKQNIMHLKELYVACKRCGQIGRAVGVFVTLEG